MTGAKSVTEDTFIRHLPYSAVRYLSLLLDVDNNWKKLLNHIPKKINSPHFEARYSQLQVRLFEEKGKRPDGSPTRAIIDDWATQNSQVRHLLQALVDASLIEAADYLSDKILKKGKVPRPNKWQAKDDKPPLGIPEPKWPDWEKKDKKETYQDDITELKAKLQKEVQGYKEGQEHSLGSDRPVHGESEALNDPECNSGNLETLYNRIPSYESGGTPSLNLDAGQERSLPSNSSIPFEDKETVLQRPVKGIEDLNERPEPCESTDIESLQFMPEGSCKPVEYTHLASITDNFNKECISKGGRVIGSGGFGTVFLGVFGNGLKVAVKSLKEVPDVNADKQFVTELEALSKYHHDNIVFLMGYSVDGPSKCLIYEYMSNGSLEDRLLRKGNTPPLSCRLRLSIAGGTAHGIHYLNCQGIIHRDIKSANVLLDDNFMPKVGDFATVRAGPMGSGSTTTVQTTLVIGTSAYLAPEAYHFDVSTKLDSFSFGVVLLEIITGLPALDHEREEKDLKSYVEERDEDLMSITDVSVEWSEEVLIGLYAVATKCLERRKKCRVNVGDILDDLGGLI